MKWQKPSFVWKPGSIPWVSCCMATQRTALGLLLLNTTLLLASVMLSFYSFTQRSRLMANSISFSEPLCIFPTKCGLSSVICANCISTSFLHLLAWSSCPCAWGKEWFLTYLGVPSRTLQQYVVLCPHWQLNYKTYISSLGEKGKLQEDYHNKFFISWPKFYPILLYHHHITFSV